MYISTTTRFLTFIMVEYTELYFFINFMVFSVKSAM